MTQLTMQEVCEKLHWHDSWSEYMKYDEAKQELIMEIKLCEWVSEEDFRFNGHEGTLIFHGISDFEIDIIISSERPSIEFSTVDCLSNDTRMGLLLAGYAYKDVKPRSYDWFTLRFYADSATWYPKTKSE
jgi:hypothetical protein